MSTPSQTPQTAAISHAPKAEPEPDRNAAVADPAATTDTPVGPTASLRQRQYYIQLDWAFKNGNAMDVTSNALRVLMYMSTNSDFDNGAVNISQQELKEITGLSYPTLRAVATELAHKKLINREGRTPGAHGNACSYSIPAATETIWGLMDPEPQPPPPHRGQLGFLPVPYNTLSVGQIDILQVILSEAGLTWAQAKPILKSKYRLDFIGQELADVPKALDKRLFKAIKKIKEQRRRNPEELPQDTAAVPARQQQELTDLAGPTDPDAGPDPAQWPAAEGEPDPAARDLWQQTLELLREELPAHIFGRWLQDTSGHRWANGCLEITAPDQETAEHLEKQLYQTLQRALNRTAGDAPPQLELLLPAERQPAAVAPSS